MALPGFVNRYKSIFPLTVMLTVVIGLAGTAVLFAMVRTLETEKLAIDFKQRAAGRIAAVGQGLARAEEALHTVNLLFETNETVTRAEFTAFTRRLIGRTPYIQSVGFQRLITAAERPAYEAQMRRDFPDFSIRKWENGVRVAAPEQPSYRVIDFIEPALENKGAFGLDTSDKTVLKEAVARAADTGQPSATNLLPLPQGKPSQDGIVIFMPIYRPGQPVGTALARRAAASGFTTIAFRAGELVSQTLAAAQMTNKSGIGVRVYVGDYKTESDLVFAESLATSPAGSPALPDLAMYPALENVQQSFDLAGRPWHVVVSPPPEVLTSRLGSLLTVVFGILATLLVAANLQMYATRTARISRVVRKRTAELHWSNVKLTAELAAREEAEQALLLRERAIESSVNAILILGPAAPDYPIIYVNPAFERITGYSAHEAIGRHYLFLRADDHGQAGLEEIRLALDDHREARAVLRNYRKDGTLFWNDLYISPVRDASGGVTHFVAAQYDITEMKRYQSELEFHASRDILTGLANRNLLNDRLKKAIAQAARYGTTIWVLVFDLDRFKLINDSLGQQAGDVVLRTIAGRLKSSAREIDTVARFGADEFVLVLPQQADDGMSTDIVQRMMNAASEYISFDQRELHVTSSVGIAVYPADGSDAESLLTHAGIAMYRAKEGGRNNFQFYRPEMTVLANDRLRIEGELHSALERCEFLLHYQPQVDLDSGAIVGMEALIRWLHPTLGMVAPLNFIGVAEDTGLIVPIGAWVIRTACLQTKQWQDAGLGNLRVAVNLSARQFAQNDLVAMIASVLRETGLAPHHLEIELTESLIMSDVQQAIQTLQQLKDLGVKISVDDFGTGYSSLSYLKRFPIDTLKIDRAFVRDIATDSDDAAIVNAIISLAHNLRMSVIAEGVETEEQLAYLKQQGCDEFQGYHFSRPLPCEEFERLVRNKAAPAAAGIAAILAS